MTRWQGSECSSILGKCSIIKLTYFALVLSQRTSLRHSYLFLSFFFAVSDVSGTPPHSKGTHIRLTQKEASDITSLTQAASLRTFSLVTSFTAFYKTFLWLSTEIWDLDCLKKTILHSLSKKIKISRGPQADVNLMNYVLIDKKVDCDDLWLSAQRESRPLAPVWC